MDTLYRTIFAALLSCINLSHLSAMELLTNTEEQASQIVATNPLNEKILQRIKMPYELPKDKTDCALITCVRYSPNGHFIAAGSKDGSIHIWDALSKKLIKTFSHRARINDIDWNSENSCLAVATNHGLYTYDTVTWKIHSSNTSYNCRSVCYSPDDMHLAVCIKQYNYDKSKHLAIIQFDSATLQAQKKYADPTNLLPSTDIVEKLERNLNKLYIHWTSDNTIEMFTSNKKSMITKDFKLTCSSRPSVACYSPNNALMAAGTENGKICIINPQTKVFYWLANKHQSSKIKSLCWNSNSNRIATVTKHGIDIWDLTTKTCIYTLQKCDNASCVHWLYENYIIAGTGSMVYVWHIKDREVAEYNMRHLNPEQKQLLDELNKLWINQAPAARYHTVLKKYDSAFNSLTPTVRIALKELLPPVNNYYKNSLTFPAKIVLGLGALAGSYVLLKNSSFVTEKLLG